MQTYINVYTHIHIHNTDRHIHTGAFGHVTRTTPENQWLGVTAQGIKLNIHDLKIL